jgi:BirA family transcriptional regulator, biotin operon repressor / biotin---[acetyl-CoA-carboxylase] ligase
MGSSPYVDLSRPPLREDSLRRALVRPGGTWSAVRVVRETGSTNADLVAAAQAGEPAGSVLVAERQGAGRGRMDRSWVAPAQASITMSVLLRPAVPAAQFGWLPLLAGVALAEEVGRLGRLDAALKWPNDLLVRPEKADSDYGKCAGVLAEAVGNAVIIGVGLNVNQRADELPGQPDPRAYPPTSLALLGSACIDRDPLVRAILRGLSTWYQRWLEAAGDPEASGLHEAYRGLCRTIGTEVAVAVPGGEVVRGNAVDVDAEGRLVVETPAGRRSLAAGDVLRVR